MPFYETVFIARQDVSAKQVEDYAKDFSKIVNDNGGTVKKVESWGLRNLAYKIKKNKKGHYTLIHIDAPAAAIKEMERNIKLNEDVLRHMTVRIDEFPEGPSAVLKHSDDERSEDGEFGGKFSRGDKFRGDRDDKFSRGDRDSGSGRFERKPAAPEGAE